MSRPTKVPVTVLVSEPGAKKVAAVKRRLESAGLGNIQSQDEIGTITGHVDPAVVARLRAIAGVSAVELGGSVQLPPPDSPVQ